MITTACCTPAASASATAVDTAGVGSAGGAGQGVVSSTTGLPVSSLGARTPPLISNRAVSPPVGTVTVAAAETAPDAGASVVDAAAPMTAATVPMVSNDASSTSHARWPRLIGWPTLI